MRILQLRSSDVFGSPERMIIGQCRHLSSFEFVCASFVKKSRPNRFLQECRARGIDVVPIEDSFPGDLRIAGCLRRLIREKEIDLVVSHDYKSSFYAYLAGRRTGSKQMAYFHGVTSENRKVRLYNAIDRYVLRRLARVVTVSSQTRKLLTDNGVREDRIMVVPNAIDDSILAPPDQERQTAASSRELIAAGRFSYEKGYDLLIRALAGIDTGDTPFMLRIYGAGPEEHRLKALVERFSLGDVVEFCGFVDDLIPFFGSKAFLIMPSRSEGMPVTVLEAWSQRLGIVASAVGGVPEVIEDGVTGLLVPPEDVGALAERIAFGLENPELMRKCGQNGYDRVKQDFTFSRQAELLRSIFDEYERSR